MRNMNLQNNSELIKEIIKQHKTPLHIVYEEKLRANCQNFIFAFQKGYPNASFFYSYKTNSIPAILRIVHSEGFGAEVVSMFELDLALRLGVQPEHIIFNGPNKGADEIRKAIELDIKLINVDSLDELMLIRKLAEEAKKKVRIGLRVRSLYVPRAHFGFAFNFKELLPAFRLIKDSRYIDLCALHLHQGTNIRSVSPYIRVIKETAKMLFRLKNTLGMEIEFLDLGGGLGVSAIKQMNLFDKIFYRYFFPYPHIFNGKVCLEDFTHSISSCLKNEFRKFNLKLPVLLFEPGRAITATAQDLFLSVINIKGKTAIVNGGLFSLTLPLTGEFHRVKIIDKETSETQGCYRICGNLCTDLDILFYRVKLPQLEVRDVLMIMDTGAYFNSLSSNFSFSRPTVVMVDKKNQFELIRRRETFEDMIGRDKME
jgi:diaminopimelate decarboxylase